MGSRLTLTGDCLEGLAPLTGTQRNPLDLINRNWNELLNLISILLLNSPNLDLMSYLQINKWTLQLNSLTPCLTCLFLFPSLWLWVLCQFGTKNPGGSSSPDGLLRFWDALLRPTLERSKRKNLSYENVLYTYYFCCMEDTLDWKAPL